MIVKILGLLDLAGSFAFLLLLFGIQPWLAYTLFCAGLLFIKGMFVFTGEPLSAIDILASIILIFSIFFAIPVAFLWIPSLLLLAKAMVSLL